MKKIKKLATWVTESTFFLCAAAAVLALSVIVIFLFMQGVPALKEIGVWNFITGTKWQPSANEFGILPMITASLLATIGAAVLGGFIGLMAALLLAEVAPETMANIIRPLINLLAGIPSVVYGFFGLMVI
ncbi:MAG: PstC family ABC transporter permease, partial [Candidatus Spyradocola sp.]